MQNHRNYKMGNAKFFLIFCVVLGHLGNWYSDDSYWMAVGQFWVYLFHMPAFIFISGLFAKRAVREDKWERAVSYIFLYLIMEINNYIMKIITVGTERASIDILSETGIPWFALAMACWILIAIMVKRFRSRYVLMAAALLGVLSGYTNIFGGFLVLQRTIIFFPFFYAGYCIKIEELTSLLKKRGVCLISALLIMVSVIVVYLTYDRIAFWRKLFRGRYGYAEINDSLNPMCGGIWRIAAYILSSVLVIAILALIPEYKVPVVSTLGRKTLPVFAFHGIFLTIFTSNDCWVNEWVLSRHIAVHCLILCVIILLVTSLPVLEWPLCKIMSIPDAIRRRCK